MIDWNMFCKLQIVIDFLRIVVCLLLSRPFGNIIDENVNEIFHK